MQESRKVKWKSIYKVDVPFARGVEGVPLVWLVVDIPAIFAARGAKLTVLMS
jgi:hypothetical protein